MGKSLGLSARTPVPAPVSEGGGGSNGNGNSNNGGGDRTICFLLDGLFWSSSRMPSCDCVLLLQWPLSAQEVVKEEAGGMLAALQVCLHSGRVGI